jgi:hypothetical protein
MSFWERLYITALVVVLVSLFIGVVEVHAEGKSFSYSMEEVSGNTYCGQLPLDSAGICCRDEDNQQNCTDIVATNDDEICWCQCVVGGPYCTCLSPIQMIDEDIIWWQIYQNRDQEVQI